MKLPANYNLLTPAQRRAARDQYVRLQKGFCYWCDAPLSAFPATSEKRRIIRRGLFPPNFFRYQVHLQHSHETGMTEGAVHAHCNAVMWQYHGR